MSKGQPTDPLPENLGHKPVFSLPYEDFDGIYAGETDIKYLSIGLAQYDTTKVSAKTMRHTGERWSRQAEELPLHRVVDLTLLLAKTLFGTESGKTQVPAGTFDHQTGDLLLVENENRTDEEMTHFHEFLSQHGDQLKQRLNTLTDVLVELRASGKI